jgi:hypothetical protein
MYVHLFNWPVSPSSGWADPVKKTTSGEALKRGGSKRATSIFMKFNRETKRPVTTLGKILMSNSEV